MNAEPTASARLTPVTGSGALLTLADHSSVTANGTGDIVTLGTADTLTLAATSSATLCSDGVRANA